MRVCLEVNRQFCLDKIELLDLPEFVRLMETCLIKEVSQAPQNSSPTNSSSKNWVYSEFVCLRAIPAAYYLRGKKL